jgi:hypothetical protein
MKKLYLFDFDETLIHNHGQIRLIKTDGTIRVLDQHEYYEYRPKPGEKIDLSDYDKVSDPIVNEKNMNLLRQHINNAQILTARPHKEPVIEYLKSIGINVPVNAVGISDANIDCILPNAHRKKDWIKKIIIQKKYDYVEFWDDNHFNIDCVNELKTDFPHVNIITHLVET